MQKVKKTNQAAQRTATEITRRREAKICKLQLPNFDRVTNHKEYLCTAFQ